MPDQVSTNKIKIGKQAVLIYALKELLDKRPSRNLFSRAKEPVGVLVERKNKGYESFLKTQDIGAGSHKVANLFSKNKDSAYFFSNIDTKLLSLLVPSIKIYKVFDEWFEQKDENGNLVPTGKTENSWRIPFDDMAVAFGDSTSEIVLETLDNLLKGTGRLNGVGIKSFNYKYTGVNPAETNTSIEATLELFFQNLDDLTKRIEIDDNDPRFVPSEDLKDKTANLKKISAKKTFAYSDLISLSSQKLKGNENINYEHFRIKAVVGYSMPTNDAISSTHPEKQLDEITKIKNFISSSKVSLDLTPFSHEIKFEQDGTIILKIDYVASIDVLMEKLDILSATQTAKKVKILTQKAVKTQEEAQQKVNEIKQSYDCDQKGSQSKEEKAIIKEAAKKTNDIQKDVYRLYQDFFDKFFTREMYTIIVDPQSAGIDSGVETSNGKYEIIQDRAGLPLKTINQDYITKSTIIKNYGKRFAADSARLNYGKTIEALRADQETFFSGVFGGFFNPNEQEQKTVDEAIIKNLNSTSADLIGFNDYNGTRYLEINFCFFGDILNSILKELFRADNEFRQYNTLLEAPKLIIGDVEISVPTDPTITRGDAVSLYIDKIKVNLADIPITMEMLEIFFYEKVIKTRRTSYPLREFIKDFINELIVYAVSPSTLGYLTSLAYGKDSLRDYVAMNFLRQNNAFRLSMVNFVVPYKKVNNTLIDNFTGQYANVLPIHYDQEENKEKEGLLTKEKIIQVKNDIVDKIDWSQFYNFFTVYGNYMYVFCSSQLPSFLRINNGNEEKDFNDGIIHFRIGTDTSMIKEISFSKQQNQFVKEARALQGSNPNPTLLQEVYDFSAKMFGNDLFKPGDLIYVEPLFFTGKKAIDIQNSIGLGGYYQVIDSQTSINDNIYETNINASLIGHININKDGSKQIVNIDTVNTVGDASCQ